MGTFRRVMSSCGCRGSVRLRSDTAGYQHSLLRYCEQGEDRRFGRIEFAVGADVTPEFKKAVLTEVGEKDWQPIYREYDGGRIQTDQEWTEVCFVPNAISHSKNAPVYRYIAIREAMGSMDPVSYTHLRAHETDSYL